MLINCVAYQNGRKLADIPVEDVSEYVRRPDCFVWVAYFEPEAPELALLAEEFGLHELAVEDAAHGHQRPKIEEYGDTLFVVLKTVDPDPAGSSGELVIGEVDLFIGRNFILSIRRGTPQGFSTVRARAGRPLSRIGRGRGKC